MRVILHKKVLVQKTPNGFLIFSGDKKGVLVGVKIKIEDRDISKNTIDNALIKLDMDSFTLCHLVGIRKHQMRIIETFPANISIHKTFSTLLDDYDHLGILFKGYSSNESIVLRHFQLVDRGSPPILKPGELTCSTNRTLNDYFDQIYFINLVHRKERREHIIHQLKELDVDFKSVQWIKAVYLPHQPQVGCAMSHLAALQHAYIHQYNKVLILEDDFTFQFDKYQLDQKLSQFMNHFPHWDVLQLSSINETSAPTNVSEVKRVIKADTTSGYGVVRDSISLLFNVFKTCLQPNPHIKGNKYAIDVAWQPLQSSLEWYIFKPYLGIQSPEFESDIELYRSLSWMK